MGPLAPQGVATFTSLIAPETVTIRHGLRGHHRLSCTQSHRVYSRRQTLAYYRWLRQHGLDAFWARQAINRALNAMEIV